MKNHQGSTDGFSHHPQTRHKPLCELPRNEHETVSVIKSNDLLLLLGGVKMAAWRGGLLRHGGNEG